MKISVAKIPEIRGVFRTLYVLVFYIVVSGMVSAVWSPAIIRILSTVLYELSKAIGRQL